MENNAGVLGYFDEQIQQVGRHTTAALEAFDAHAVHQARVGTRRLKAGLDLVEPLLAARQVRQLKKAGKGLRRRLGPLRDLDVMIDHLQKDEPPAGVAPAQAWLIDRLEKRRRDARIRDTEKGQKAEKVLVRFDGWWAARRALEPRMGEVQTILAHALHERLQAFAQQADWVSGVQEVPEDRMPIDVHQVRIEGKALRYTLEIASAQGLEIPDPVFKRFKAMQGSLGTWHDYVVLCETAMRESAERMLAHHEPRLAEQTLELAKRFLKKAGTELAAFRSQWKRGGRQIRRAIESRVPATLPEVSMPDDPVQAIMDPSTIDVVAPANPEV